MAKVATSPSNATHSNQAFRYLERFFFTGFLLRQLRLVPQALHGDDLEVLHILQPVPQAADMGLDRVLPALRHIAPHIIQQLAAGEDLAGVGQQLIEKFKFLFRQLHGPAAVGVCGKVLDTLDGYAGQGISYEVINNEADNITVTLQSILQALLVGVLLAMAVLFLFFGDWKGSLVVGISMPLSVLLAIIVLNFAGFDMNVLTGTGLILAIGMIVDNSIVILESCFRFREQGLSFQEAAAQGTSSMLMSILAGTLTTVVVYVPLSISQGMAGMMFGPLLWTIILTLLGDDMDALRAGAEQVRDMMAQTPGAISMQVRYLLNGLTAATVDDGDQEYDIVLEYPKGKYEDVVSVMDYPIRTQTGKMVTLHDVADVTYDSTLPVLTRQDGQYSVTLTATTDETKYSAANAISAAAEALDFPAGVRVGEDTRTSMQNDELSTMVSALLASLFLVFLVMAVQFNSVKMSIMVMMKEMSYIVIDGLIASTVLAMFLVPPFYLLMRGERVDGSKRSPLFKRKKAETESASR